MVAIGPRPPTTRYLYAEEEERQMAKILEFRVPAKRLLLGLLITVVPISLVAIYAASRAGQQAQRSAGTHLESTTQSTAALVSEHLRAKVIEAALMASDAAVRDVVAASNQRFANLDGEALQKRLLELDESWNTPASESAVNAVLSNRAAVSLRRKLAIDPAFLRVTVTDGNGATVAATHKTLDYYQADEPYWQAIYAEGRGGISLTDVLYDEATKTYYMGVGAPVTDDNNAFIGTLDALVEVSSLFPLVRRTELGAGGSAAVVTADGQVIVSSSGASVADRAVAPEFEAFEDAAASFRNRSAGHFTAEFPDRGETYVAFAGIGLGDELQQLDWMVVASQPAQELLAVASGTQILIMAIALLSLASVVFLAVYFQLHTQSDIEEIEDLRHGRQGAPA